MKLIFCKKCNTVINLSHHEKRCECGASGGRYIDAINAEYWGEDAVAFAIDNYSFFARIRQENNAADEVYDKWHGKGRIQCWILQVGQPGIESIKKLDIPK